MKAKDMRLKNLGSNQNELELDGVTIFFSYSVPVAAQIGRQFYRTSEKFSVTTSKHLNAWLSGATPTLKSQSFFTELLTVNRKAVTS